MLKKMIFSTTLCVGLVLSANVNTVAQGKSKNEELKLEREALRAEMKSKEAEERKAKYEKLVQPSASGVNSVDELAVKSTKILTSTKEINAQLPEIYKRTIGESVDGVADITVKKPTLEELVTLAETITKQITAASEAAAAVLNASSDIKGVSPMQAPKATKSLNYSKDVLALVGPELNLNMRIINNLIATLKSTNNN